MQILGLRSPVSVSTTTGRSWQSHASLTGELEMAVTSHSRCLEHSVQLINVPALRTELLDVMRNFRRSLKSSVFICLVSWRHSKVGGREEGRTETPDLLMFSLT